MTKAPLCLALLALALGASTAEAAKFYKWTDADGVTHYSADPPADASKASEVRVKNRSSAAAPAGGDAAPASGTGAADADAGAGGMDKKERAGKDKKDEPAKATGKEPAQYAEKCKQLRQDLQTIQEHERIKTRDVASGEVRVLTEDERNSRLDDTQRQIKAYCE